MIELAHERWSADGDDNVSQLRDAGVDVTAEPENTPVALRAAGVLS